MYKHFALGLVDFQKITDKSSDLIKEVSSFDADAPASASNVAISAAKAPLVSAIASPAILHYCSRVSALHSVRVSLFDRNGKQENP